MLTFRVPTESDTASTTELRVTLPDSTPILSVATQPKPGWTATVTKKNLPSPQKDDDGNVITQYVSEIDWKADNPQAAIPPGQIRHVQHLGGTAAEAGVTHAAGPPNLQRWAHGQLE